MGSKGGSSVEYTQSPEQRQMYNLVMPTAQDVFGKAGEIGSTGKNGETVSLWGNQAAPASPTAPSMSRVYSGVSPVAYSGYNLGNYDLPSSSSLMPTSGWYSGLDESIKAGLNEPWNEARSSMFETLGTNLGSARGGFSGAAGAALGEFEANRANQMGLQAWEMMQPGLMADYNAQTQRAQDIFGAQTTANQYLTNLENTQLSQLRQEKQQESMETTPTE